MKKHNFYAGPSILSEYAINNTIEGIRNFADTGLSVLEISHRSKEFQAVIDGASALVKELLDIPEGYSVLWLGGGASLQFCMMPYNFLKTKAAFTDTGTWAHNAIKEAGLFGEALVLASSADANYSFIPKGYTVPEDVDYFHYTSNNTIYGTEVRKDPDVPVRMIADMSSDIFSRPVDVSTMLDYRTHIKKGSMFNTPPVLPIFTAYQTLKWYKELGGVEAIEKIDLEKAKLLYGAIDDSRIFQGTVADPEDRSIMNVCFVMKPEYKELEKDFLDFVAPRGIVGIKGHRSVGGFRASLYNALPIESVKVLVDAMKDFEAKH